MLNRKSTTTSNGFETEYEDETTSRAASRTTVTGRQVSHDQIARRAYEIYKSGAGGTPEDNWYRAERELRARA